MNYMILPFTGCQLVKNSGNPACGQGIKQYFFDKEKVRCSSFLYHDCGGGGGNDNRFNTREECQFSCACRGMLDHGSHCPVNPGDKPVKSEMKYYYDSVSEFCRPFWYIGCGGNHNRFKTKQRCYDVCKPGTIRESPPTKYGPTRKYEDRNSNNKRQGFSQTVLQDLNILINLMSSMSMNQIWKPHTDTKENTGKTIILIYSYKKVCNTPSYIFVFFKKNNTNHNFKYLCNRENDLIMFICSEISVMKKPASFKTCTSNYFCFLFLFCPKIQDTRALAMSFLPCCQIFA